MGAGEHIDICVLSLYARYFAASHVLPGTPHAIIGITEQKTSTQGSNHQLDPMFYRISVSLVHNTF